MSSFSHTRTGITSDLALWRKQSVSSSFSVKPPKVQLWWFSPQQDLHTPACCIRTVGPGAIPPEHNKLISFHRAADVLTVPEYRLVKLLVWTQTFMYMTCIIHVLNRLLLLSKKSASWIIRCYWQHLKTMLRNTTWYINRNVDFCRPLIRICFKVWIPKLSLYGCFESRFWFHWKKSWIWARAVCQAANLRVSSSVVSNVGEAVQQLAGEKHNIYSKPIYHPLSHGDVVLTPNTTAINWTNRPGWTGQEVFFKRQRRAREAERFVWRQDGCRAGL